VPTSAHAPVDSLIRQVVVDLEGDRADVDGGCAETELSDAQQRLLVLEREASAARSKALAVFAELESVRRTAGTNGRTPGGAFSSALRARLTRPMPASWVGASPIVLDDTLAACPSDDVEAARAAVLDAAQRAQVVYFTGDPDTLAWASRLPADLGTVTRVPAR
jgi:hypothetical protein